MSDNWAAEHLQTIRTLMERSALYRRALAPMMLWTGLVGAGGAFLGWFMPCNTPRTFVGCWLAAGLLAIVGAFLLVRRQALRERESFWSPPTRRVAVAALPAAAASLALGLAVALPTNNLLLSAWCLPPVWMVLYGAALHAAGSFMQRGVKLFGWGFVLAGCLILVGFAGLGAPPPLPWAHLVMGATFGAGHLAYGMYLYFTEPRENVA